MTVKQNFSIPLILTKAQMERFTKNLNYFHKNRKTFPLVFIDFDEILHLEGNS